jgi:hypothetical protein
MLTSVTRPTAKVIPFPRRGRLGFAGHLPDLDTSVRSAAVPAFDSFGSWYHEEAVREAAEHALKP